MVSARDGLTKTSTRPRTGVLLVSYGASSIFTPGGNLHQLDQGPMGAYPRLLYGEELAAVATASDFFQRDFR
jgi:hypothetical protein